MKFAVPLQVGCLALFGWALAARQAPPPTRTVDFGREVKPILVQHCYKCHGPDATKAAAGLRLDSRDGAIKRLDDGAAIVPGNPDHSILLQRVSAKGDAQMPPTDSGLPALTAAEVDTLRLWISQGAKFTKHWSFVPPAMPDLPTVRHTAWCRNLVDRFVVAKLEAAHLEPEPEADRDTLALRAAETLTGLPPTDAELTKFRSDKAPGAYERYVDQLLASPAYGEQQARYWLDAVRYGDTHGLQLDNERSVYPYRDWVVRAFNQDLPFDKFIEWQLAGDLLPHPTTEQLIATGYVRMNLTSNEGGAIAEEFLARNTFDRVDTTSTVFLGMTVACARCHDHKYDPISQRDYYGLYAFFDSTKDEPLDGNISLPPPYIAAPTPEQAAKLTALKADRATLEAQVPPDTAAKWLTEHLPPAVKTADWEKSPVYSAASFNAAFDTAFPPESGSGTWAPLVFKVGENNDTLVGKDAAAVYVRGKVTLPAAAHLTLAVRSDDGVKVWLNGKLIHANRVTRGLATGVDSVPADFLAGDNVIVAKVINSSGPDGLNISFESPADQMTRKLLAAYQTKPEAQANRTAVVDAFLQVGPMDGQGKKYRDLVKAETDLQGQIPMTLIAQEMDAPRPTYVLKRGLYDQKGDRVTRHVPAVLGDLPAGAPQNRLGLARWLASPSNPLVARVFVNRMWQQCFGTGLVKTAEDFGSQGELPVNQPLLDYLSVSFVKHGWSVKQLSRLMVTSAAFRQASRITPEKRAKDPENRLVSRGPRFRLDAEEIRDKALAAGGLLLTELGGHGVKPYQPDGLWESSSDPASATHIYVRDKNNQIYRRSLYLFWKRTSPPPAMTNFDAPLRDTCIVRRSVTNTPLQALTVMNEPAFLESSRTMAYRLLSAKLSDQERLRLAYEIALNRAPKPFEQMVLLRALARYRAEYGKDVSAAKKLLAVGDSPQSGLASPSEEAAWMLVCSTLMNTDEFITLH